MTTHASAKKTKSSPSETALENRRTALREADSQTAADTIPYLVLDFHNGRIVFRMGGAVVKECLFHVGSDSQAVREFVDAGTGEKTPLRRVDRVHLFQAAECVGDTVLSIVSEVTRAGEEQIQRYVPESMLIVLSDGTRITAHTDIAGETLSSWRNTKEKVVSFLASLIGKESLTIDLSGPDAMALYGVCRDHPAILLLP